MSDLPRKTVARTAKLATLPIGFAGRTVLGLGKRTLGKPAELVAQEIQTRTAEQLFKVLGELKERLHNELDYAAEAAAQITFREGYADEPDYLIPEVVAQAEHVLVTEWVDGTPLSRLIDNDVDQAERDRVGLLYLRFLLSGP